MECVKKKTKQKNDDELCESSILLGNEYLAKRLGYREEIMSEEHKSNYCKKHMILPSYDESICRECDSDNKTLKSLGLYWRKWPEEKPQLGSNIILKKISSDKREWIMPAVFSNSYTDKPIFVCWGAQVEKPLDGDLWLPLSELEVLK